MVVFNYLYHIKHKFLFIQRCIKRLDLFIDSGQKKLQELSLKSFKPGNIQLPADLIDTLFKHQATTYVSQDIKHYAVKPLIHDLKR